MALPEWIIEGIKGVLDDHELGDCMVCGRWAWKVRGGYLELVFRAPPGDAVRGLEDPGLFVAITCRNCGHTLFFDRDVLVPPVAE